MYMNVHSRFIHNSQKVEITRVHQLMNGWTKCRLAIQCNIIWQERGIKYDTCNNMETLCEVKAARHKGTQNVRFIIIWNIQNRHSYRGRYRLGKGQGTRGVTVNGHRDDFRRDTNVPKLDCGNGCATLNIIKKLWTEYFKWVNCIACKRHLNKAVLKKRKTSIIIILVWIQTWTKFKRTFLRQCGGKI